jgi:hypothetical protein
MESRIAADDSGLMRDRWTLAADDLQQIHIVRAP